MAKQYSRQSMDRFGDDLCQHLLSYLSLEGRFKYECISKQWQRLIYRSVNDISDEDLVDRIGFSGNVCGNWRPLICLLRKCPNIRLICLSLEIITDTAFDIITEMCPHLHTINFGIHDLILTDDELSSRSIDDLFAKYGKQLNTLVLPPTIDEPNDLEKALVKNVHNCHNLVNLSLFNDSNDDRSGITDDRFKYLINENKMLFPKLKKIAITYNNDLIKVFDTFVKQYKNQMKAIAVELQFNTDDKAVIKLANGLTQMKQLIDLAISDYMTDEMLDYIPNNLCYFAFNGNKLKRLLLNNIVVKDINVMSKILDIIANKFMCLTQLEFSGNFLEFPENYYFESKSFKQIKRLTHLVIMPSKDKSLNSEFFININDNLPHLQYLCLSKVEISSQSLDWLSRLRRIRNISLFIDEDIEVPDNDIMMKCPKIVSFLVNGEQCR